MATNPRAEALGYWQRLSDEYGRYLRAVQTIPLDNMRLQDDLRRYLCLRCSGFLEQVAYTILSAHLDIKSSGPAKEFAKSWFKRAPNLTVEEFRTLIARFGESYGTLFDTFLSEKDRKDTLGSLMAIRNKVAHGLEFKGARLDPVQFIELCEDTYNWLVETFLGNSVQLVDNHGNVQEHYVQSDF